jgi:hypothetical protein
VNPTTRDDDMRQDCIRRTTKHHFFLSYFLLFTEIRCQIYHKPLSFSVSLSNVYTSSTWSRILYSRLIRASPLLLPPLVPPLKTYYRLPARHQYSTCLSVILGGAFFFVLVKGPTGNGDCLMLRSYTKGVYFLFDTDCADLIRRRTMKLSIWAASGQMISIPSDLVLTVLIRYWVSTSSCAWIRYDYFTIDTCTIRVLWDKLGSSRILKKKKKLGIGVRFLFFYLLKGLGWDCFMCLSAFISSLLQLLLCNHTEFIVINRLLADYMNSFYP